MRSHAGRGSKRKAETNFVDAYSGASELAPPPTARETTAVPSKLRKIMRLKSQMAGEPRAEKGREGKSSKVGKNGSHGGKVKDIGKKSSKEISHGTGTEPQSKTPDESAEKKKSSFANKWKKGEEELKKLVEKMDRRDKTGIKTGVSQRRKTFLKEKKKKGRQGKRSTADDADALPAFNEYEKVKFGDVVQAPPKLSFPRKAADVKEKEKVKLSGHQAVMRDNLRLEVIESYRKLKDSSGSGGNQLRSLSFAEREA